MDHPPSETRENVDIDEHGETRQDEDVVAHRENEIARITGFVWMILGIIEVFIGLRIILKLLAANPDNPFASFVYQVSHAFLSPFFGLVGEPVSGGSVLEISSIIGGVVYLLVFWGITRLIYLVLSPSRVRHVRTIQRH